MMWKSYEIHTSMSINKGYVLSVAASTLQQQRWTVVTDIWSINPKIHIATYIYNYTGHNVRWGFCEKKEWRTRKCPEIVNDCKIDTLRKSHEIEIKDLKKWEEP